MKSRPVRGFTLIELAIVTAIIGLLAAGAVTSFGAIRVNTKIKETGRNLHAAELLLEAFVARQSRLPCPADPSLGPAAAAYARESSQGAPGLGCAGARLIAGTNVYWGTLPALTLGSAPRAMTDGWNHPFFYVVTGTAVRTGSLTLGTWSNDGAVPPNEIELWTKADGDASLPARTQIVNQGVVALISAGANGSGAFTLEGARLEAPVATALSEVDNQDADIFFVAADYSTTAATPFDDIVRVMTEDDILMPLATIGDLQTKKALTRERMQRLVDLIFGFAAGDVNQRIPDNSNWTLGTQGSGLPFAPPPQIAAPWVTLGITQTRVRDAWNNFFTYPVDADREICTGDGTTAVGNDTLFSLTAPGDLTITISFTRTEAVGRLQGAGMTLAACP